MIYAQLDTKNIVSQVILADADFITTLPGTWVKGCPDGINPKNYPGIGYTWVEQWNAFIPPRPSTLWELDIKTMTWKEKKRRLTPLEGPTEPGEYNFTLKDNNGKTVYTYIEAGLNKANRSKVPVVITGILLDTRR